MKNREHEKNQMNRMQELIEKFDKGVNQENQKGDLNEIIQISWNVLKRIQDNQVNGVRNGEDKGDLIELYSRVASTLPYLFKNDCYNITEPAVRNDFETKIGKLHSEVNYEYSVLMRQRNPDVNKEEDKKIAAKERQMTAVNNKANTSVFGRFFSLKHKAPDEKASSNQEFKPSGKKPR